jgi:hypothetical protein
VTQLWENYRLGLLYFLCLASPCPILRTCFFSHNNRVLGLFPSSGILESRKHAVSETGSLSVLKRGGRHLLSWVPEKELTSITGPDLAWGLKEIKFPKRHVFCFLEYRTMEKVKKTAILSVILHRQNPLESTCSFSWFCDFCFLPAQFCYIIV